jgi:serine/threonine protein kinase
VGADDRSELTELERLTGGRPCDLGNIEVYFRIGVYHEERGDLAKAIEMFELVEETSPGYREAWKRVDALRARPVVAPAAAPASTPAVRSTSTLTLTEDIIVEHLREIDQVLATLENLHSRRVIHGDVHPSSIVRFGSGVVSLQDSDRGLALGGSPYHPAEQLAGESIDGRCDLFAVAVILYERLSGRLPFDGNDRTTPPPLLSELVPAVPLDLDELVMRALAPRKEDRWSSAFVMRARLAKVIAALSSTSAPPPA